MKIRLDFVTNSSSSSFILGEPGECKLTTKDAFNYLDEIEKKIKNNIYDEYIIDLKYDESIEYSKSEIEFLIEVICWYVDDFRGNINEDVEYDEEANIWWRINEDYEYEESDTGFLFDDIDENFTQEKAKKILNFAHKTLGEILVGNELEDISGAFEFIYKDKNIKFKCNHMG